MHISKDLNEKDLGRALFILSETKLPLSSNTKLWQELALSLKANCLRVNVPFISMSMDYPCSR